MNSPTRCLHTTLWLALLLTGLLGAAACHSQHTITAADSAAWKLSLTTTPTPPASASATAFVLHVSDATGQPVAGGSAGLDLVMTVMDMGPNHVVLTQQSSGVYTGSGQFSMSGPWRVDATFTAGGQTRKQSFLMQVN